MSKWQGEDYTQIQLSELCKRLRGEYGAVSDYKPEPLKMEAARRLEELVEERDTTATNMFDSREDMRDERDRLRAEVAELMKWVEMVAMIPLWTDTYPDSKSDRLLTPVDKLLTPDHVRKARAILARTQKEEQ